VASSYKVAHGKSTDNTTSRIAALQFWDCPTTPFDGGTNTTSAGLHAEVYDDREEARNP
jgi:hypothetical protein